MMFRMTPLLAATILAFVSTAGARAQDTDVYVIHGIQGQDLGMTADLPVDISVNGACTLTDFKFGDIVGPLSLPAGTYQVDISLADPVNPCSNPPVISAAVPLGSGQNVTILAHLDDTGTPTASVFQNDITAPGFKRNRVQLHHAAFAPAVDVRVSGFWHRSVLLTGVTNGQSARDVFLFDKVDVRVTAAGTSTVVVGPATLTTPAYQLTNIYVVGSLTNGTLTVLTHSIDTL